MENKLDVVSVKPEMIFTEKDVEYRLLSNDVESQMDNSISEFHNFIKEEKGIGFTEEQLDAIYLRAQNYIKDLKRELRDSKFSFYMNRPQYTFLTNLILKKLDYDVNTVFIAIELTDLMVGMRDLKYQDDKSYIPVQMTPTEVTYLYHLISTYKVKGLHHDAYTFASILRRIGEISKIINFYDNESKTLTSEITIWAATLGGDQIMNNVGDDSKNAISIDDSSEMSDSEIDRR